MRTEPCVSARCAESGCTSVPTSVATVSGRGQWSASKMTTISTSGCAWCASVVGGLRLCDVGGAGHGDALKAARADARLAPQLLLDGQRHRRACCTAAGCPARPRTSGRRRDLLQRLLDDHLLARACCAATPRAATSRRGSAAPAPCARTCRASSTLRASAPERMTESVPRRCPADEEDVAAAVDMRSTSRALLALLATAGAGRRWASTSSTSGRGTPHEHGAVDGRRGACSGHDARRQAGGDGGARRSSVVLFRVATLPRRSRSSCGPRRRLAAPRSCGSVIAGIHSSMVAPSAPHVCRAPWRSSAALRGRRRQRARSWPPRAPSARSSPARRVPREAVERPAVRALGQRRHRQDLVDRVHSSLVQLHLLAVSASTSQRG